MARKRRTSWVVWLRRISQSAFFVLFVWLFLETAFHPINRVGGPVKLFFELDQLVALTVWLTRHAISAAFTLALAVVVITLLFGRWFCGWLCPFGALHSFFSMLRGGKAKARIAVGGYSTKQKVKYAVLVVFLAGALMGQNAVGILDPMSFLYRSMATAVYPATHSSTQGVFKWIYDVNPHVGGMRLTAVTEPIYDVLYRYFLPPDQPYFVGALLIGSLFIGALALNLYRSRFYCRYVCPLGALLGVVGKNPLVRVTKVPENCNDCLLCVADCQGGANPSGGDGWKPSECLYCWSCDDACPTNGIRIRFGAPKEERP
jgi:polyferredoxin